MYNNVQNLLTEKGSVKPGALWEALLQCAVLELYQPG